MTMPQAAGKNRYKIHMKLTRRTIQLAKLYVDRKKAIVCRNTQFCDCALGIKKTDEEAKVERTL